MTTAYTSLLGLALPVQGELAGTWGDVVNNSITSLLDSAIAGTTNVSTDGDVTLTTTTGAANTAREAILLFSGARTALRTVTAPAQSKIYTVINATTGGYAVKLVGAGPTTGVTIANGSSTTVAWNGSDFVEVSSPSSIILPNGTANGVLYLNGSKVVTSGSALTFDGSSLFVGATSAAAGKLVVKDTASSNTLWLIGRTSDGASSVSFRNAADSAYSGRIEVDATSGMQFGLVGGAEGMRLDTSGNLGLGVTPSAWGSVFKSLEGTYGGSLTFYANGNFPSTWLSSNAYHNGTNWIAKVTDQAGLYSIEGTTGKHIWSTVASDVTAGNAISFTQAMSLLATGELVIGKTAVSNSTAGVTIWNYAGGAGTSTYVKTLSGQYTAAGFYYAGTNVGYIDYTNSATIYSTSSDVRLKKDIVDAPSASAKIDQIRIVSHGWKHDNEVVEFGTIAQELHAIAPQAVIKGDDNNLIEKTWAVDYSKLVPMLIKEVQELRQRVATLEAK